MNDFRVGRTCRWMEEGKAITARRIWVGNFLLGGHM